MDDLGQQEPIFELATECEVLYAAQISRLNDEGDPNAAKLLSDVYQRFSAWAAFLGVFAETNVCLDRRLRRHIEIQDQVLRLLDIMRNNLSDCELSVFSRGLRLCDKIPELMMRTVFEHGNSPDSDNSDTSEKRSATVNIKGLDAISGALERLNQLGTAIRRSSVTSQISKARDFAANFDLTSFEQVANMLLRTLYSDASDGMIELLTRSMAESYALFLHRKSRQERLGISRPSRPGPRLQTPLTQILEEPTGASDDPDAMNIDLGALRVSDSLAHETPQARLPPPVYNVPQSEPTSVDTQELKARLRRLTSPSIISKPVSILVNQAEYPRPAKASLMCEWCFGPLMTDFREKTKWQEHMNEDFKPYICLSEKCAESMPRFASSRQWLLHMVSTHGENWHREVHAPASWVCPLCTELEASFDSPEGLSTHLDDCHTGIFSEQQMKAIVRQSLFRVPRSKETCPLCHFPIGDEQATKADQEDTTESNQQGKHSTTKPSDGESKRLKTDTGYTKMGDHADADVDENKTLAANSECKDDSVSRGRLGVQAVGSHVAAHLQLVMLLTLRLISIDGAVDHSTGSQCGPSEIDDQASWVSSGPRAPDQEISDTRWDLSSWSSGNNNKVDPDTGSHATENVPDTSQIDWDDLLERSDKWEVLEVLSWNSSLRSSRNDDNIDLDTRSDATENVPDSEPVDWHGALGMPSNTSKYDHVSADVIETLTQPQPVIEPEKKILDRFRPYYSAIKALVDFEYSFGRDMKVVDELYKRTADSCLDLSRDDIRIIFRNSGEVVQLSLDLQASLAEAIKAVHIDPKSQHRSNRRLGTSQTPFTDDEQPGSQTELRADEVRSTSIGRAFLAYNTRIEHVYVEYLKKLELADERLRALEKKPRATLWLKACQEAASDLTNTRDLHTLLALPLHHALCYPQILESLLSLTPIDHPDWQNLGAACKELNKMVLAVSDAREQQRLRQNVIRRIPTDSSSPTGFLRGLNRWTRKSSTVSDPDTEFAALQEKFGEGFDEIQVLKNDIDLYTQNFLQSIDTFMEIVTAAENLAHVLPSNYPELESKWKNVEIAADNIMSTMVPDHLDVVRQCVSNPLVELIKLYDKPWELMKFRNDSLPGYLKYVAASERGEQPGKKTTDQAQKFRVLNETLKDELPKLSALSAKLAQASLRNLVDLETTWFAQVQEELRPLIAFPKDTQEIMRTWEQDFIFGQAQVLSLAICNGDLLTDTAFIRRDNLSTLEPASSSNPLSANASNSIPTLPELTLDPPRNDFFESSMEPDSPRLQDHGKVESASADPVDTSPKVLFVATSLFEFHVDRLRTEGGYPYLTYDSGEIFDVFGEKDELWLAKNQDDPTQQVGWIWNKHFAKLAPLDGK